MRRKRILVVDDNPTNLDIVQEMLGDEHSLFFAEDASGAIALAMAHSPHIVLLDVMLPGIDGYELCSTLRNMPETSRARIIMVTAKAMPSERFRGFEVGADAYLTKPFDDGDLMSELREYDKHATAHVH